MLRILFSGPILERSTWNTGRPQCWTYNRRVWLDKNNNGKRKKHRSYKKREIKTQSHLHRKYNVWSTKTSGMVVSKLYFVLGCMASGTWWCVPLASSGCRVIFVSAECHCSPLNILESHGVAVRGRERETRRRVSVTRRGGNVRQTHVLLPSGGVMGGYAAVAVIKRVLLPCASMHGKTGANLQSLC